MNIEYIIVQAGGLGTRLEYLTHNRPKGIVPVSNKPVIFHLFDKYPTKKFIVIGDYKYDVLERYLRNFAKVDYLLVKAEGKGNAAGMKEALRFVPKDQPVMIIWSDLILSAEYRFPKETKPCYIGLSGNFVCSWKFENGNLDKIRDVKNGVAGCFIFDKAERLDSLPIEGSFTSWLKESKIELSSMDMWNSVEVGTIAAIQEIDTGENRCRPYNHMEFKEDRVEKTGLTEEGCKLIDREVRWYDKMSEYGFDGIPKIYSLNPLTMERIYGENIFKASLTDEEKKQTIDRLVDTLNKLHNYERVECDYYGLQEDYFNKTIKRILSIREVIPYTNSEYILINGVKCKNVFFFQNELEKSVHKYLFEAEFGPIHGDCTLTNTMIDADKKIYYIDARGYFGKREIYGDIYYDWAKLYYSIAGSFDQFNIKNFKLDIGDNQVFYQISNSGWEHLTEYFLQRIDNCDTSRIRLIHAIIWLSLASHCWEDYDSMCLAFYNGLYLWNEWMKECDVQ